MRADDRRDRGGARLSLLLQARLLILCALPYGPTSERSISRIARIGRSTFLRVTFTSIDDGVLLPYDADRALFGWIQTRAYETGFVALDALSAYFDAFGLTASGRDYRRFRERLRRLESLAISIRVDAAEESAGVRLHPLKRSFLPLGDGAPAAATEVPVVLRRRRYGFELDPDFWRYLRANPVPLPLPLMRRFHNRPMAWDFAAFVLYRSHVARAPAVVPWRALGEQLGSVDTNPRRLRARLERVLDEIRSESAGLRTRFLAGREGLLIEPWRRRP